MDGPNILFIMTDQQRWDAMGCSGGWVRTPNLDRIASEGVRFSNCITTSPVCISARVSMATGLYPHNTGVWKNIAYDMPPDTPTWMQAVRKAGYRTSLFGKTHLHRHTGGDLREKEHLLHAYGLDDVDEIAGPRAAAGTPCHMTERWDKRGLWDAYKEDYKERFSNKPYVVRPSTLPLEEYADVYVGQQAKHYLASYDRDQPWFCWVSFGGPHEPWDAPEPYASMYDPAAMPKPTPGPDSTGKWPDGILKRRLEQPVNPSPEDIAAMRANYAGNITLIDDQIGEILDTIKNRGELDNTVIVFTSDHGELNGDHGLIYKETFLNGSVRVPLLVRTPDTIRTTAAGSVCESPAEWFDVGPTLVELAGGALDHEHDSRSLCPTLKDPQRGHRPFALSEYDHETMYMDRRWKLMVNKNGQPYALFDLDNDPDETRNLVHDAARERDMLAARLQEFLRRTTR